jgi:hypothetical protein
MFLLNPRRASHDLICETWTFPGDGGLNLVFSHFDGYSPLLDGSVRAAVVESSDCEKTGSIIVKVIVKASSPTCKLLLSRTHAVTNPLRQ